MTPRKKALDHTGIVGKSEHEDKDKEQKKETQFILSIEANKIIESFKSNLEAENKFKTTIKSYLFDVKSFMEFMEFNEKPFIGIFAEVDYKNYISSQKEKNFKIATLNKRINSLRSFNQFLVKQNFMDTVLVDLKQDKL